MRRCFLVAILVAVSLVGCNPSPTVSARLQDAFTRAGNGDMIRLNDLTGFEWEAFFVFGPYTTREVAEEALGFPWPEYDRFALGTSDSFSLLVFTDGSSVVRAEEHPRCKPDFSPGTLSRPLSPEAAIFSIDRTQACPQARTAV
jgi:hypothetical protein